jgi:hypothetical protein
MVAGRCLTAARLAAGEEGRIRMPQRGRRGEERRDDANEGGEP